MATQFRRVASGISRSATGPVVDDGDSLWKSHTHL
jgi:hypothetical protein